jgi:hypothetical protein
LLCQTLTGIKNKPKIQKNNQSLVFLTSGLQAKVYSKINFFHINQETAFYLLAKLK